jgi:hypothetical protein
MALIRFHSWALESSGDSVGTTLIRKWLAEKKEKTSRGIFSLLHSFTAYYTIVSISSPG